MAQGATRRDTCRLCGDGRLVLVVPMPPTAIADAYVTREQLGQPQSTWPLDLHFCSACGHVQLRDVVDPRLMFRDDYTYRSGSSEGIVRHFREYATELIARDKPPAGSLVIDVGSNDGTFLGFFRDRGLRTLGVDPAADLARRASASGIETVPRFLDPELARTLRAGRGPARIVTANNVFAHADDLGALADAIRLLLADDGLFAFEVSYLVDVVDKMLLGTIFHEHLSYHTLHPLRSFLQRHELDLFDAEHVGIQGGSVIGYAQPVGGGRPTSPRLEEMVLEEERRGFLRAETFHAFAGRMEETKASVQRALEEYRSEGAIAAGYGAARSGTTILARFGLGGLLGFLVDDSPEKQGLFSPGDHLPILSPQALYERKPDVVVILAWVHAKAILTNHAEYLRRGGRFLSIYPKVEVTTHAGTVGRP